MLAPGYVIGRLMNLFEFRQHRFALRLVLALPLSIAICPMLTYVLGRFLPPALWLFYIGVSIAWVLLLANDARSAKLWPSQKEILFAVSVVSLWGVVAIGSMVDLQIGNHLYPPIIAFDHSVRTAMTVEVARHIPPNNPFFANAAAPLRYHYLWLLFCSLPMNVVHLSARYMVAAGVFWCGLGLVCAIALGLKFLLAEKANIAGKTLLSIGLLSITGLDVLPNLYVAHTFKIWLADMEKWNESQIDSWASALLWVPHNVAGLIACFVAFVLLRHQADIQRRWATGPVIMAGMAFASAAGMSVYVTFTFVVAIVLWLLATAARKDWLELAMFVIAGVVSLGWAASFLSGLRAPAGGGAFVEAELRTFSTGILVLRHFGIDVRMPFDLLLANALLLPINYAMELGFFFAVGLLRLRQLVRGKIEASANELAAWTLVASSFLIGTFLRSSSIGTNDLGWRCFLPAQLILLLWGGTMLHEWWCRSFRDVPAATSSRWVQGSLAALLIVGMAGSAYQLFMLRMFPVLLDRGTLTGLSWVPSDRQFGERAYALRTAFEDLDRQLPPSAVLQSNPASKDLILHMLYSNHDAAAGDGACGADFGGDPAICASRLRTLAGIFNLPDGVDVDAVCQQFGIDTLVIENTDSVWRQPNSWVWTRPPSVANEYVRAFRCGSFR